MGYFLFLERGKSPPYRIRRVEAGYGAPAPSTLPYVTPRAKRPISDMRTRVKVRAHVSTRSVSSGAAPAGLMRLVKTPALTASAMVAKRMIRNTAIKPQKSRAWTLSGSASLPITTTHEEAIVAMPPDSRGRESIHQPVIGDEHGLKKTR